MFRLITAFVFLALVSPGLAETLRVPKEYQTIQAAIDSAKPGDSVLVSAGRYEERLRLKSEIIVRSAGDDSFGKKGLKRAERTILDGGGKISKSPGVQMAHRSTLDGFTVTNVGLYEAETWKHHFETSGEELADEQGSVQVDDNVSAISIQAVDCTVRNNIVHHNGSVGIAVSGTKNQRITPLISNNNCFRNMGGGIGVADGAEPVIKDNSCSENLRAGIGCRNSSPLILHNTCFQNIRAGIGCREAALPIVRGNKCFRNRRAGIGVRMEGTAPVVEDNECYENEMAGIGSRDEAEPIIRNNKCYKNKMAGIGNNGSKALIMGNECRENLMAGIGLQGNAEATIQKNKCIENKLVAIGVTQGSMARILDNELFRTGGVPPIIAVKDNSTALIHRNKLSGGGVAAILVQGTATISENQFNGNGGRQGSAIWVWKGSKVTVDDNLFKAYRHAVNASGAELMVTDNTVKEFQGQAFVVNDSSTPPIVVSNVVVTKDEKAELVLVKGRQGIIADNVVRSPEQPKK